jgi:hypothetical protein
VSFQTPAAGVVQLADLANGFALDGQRMDMSVPVEAVKRFGRAGRTPGGRRSPWSTVLVFAACVGSFQLPDLE